MTPMKRRLILAAFPIVTALLAVGCASAPTPADYAAERPALDLKRYFDGPLLAHGVFTGQGRWRGVADDVVGEAQGEVAGNALRWRYPLALPVDGIFLGEVTLAFSKQ